MAQTEAQRLWYQANKERLKDKARGRYIKIGRNTVPKEIQRERRIAYGKQYRLDNTDRLKAYQTAKSKTVSYKRMSAAREAKRRATKLNATPQWANIDVIKEVYMNCPEGYHVDHIVPLQGKNVTGLHVETNLQYLPAKVNQSKSNKWEV
jgi:hypothetical protein